MNELDIFVAEAAQEHSNLTEDIRWRLVYFKPNAYSNEAISVGVIVSWKGKVFVDHVCSVDAIEAFTSVFGAGARDQLIFGIEVLKQWVTDSRFDFASCSSPTNVLALGRATTGVCDDVSRFSRDLLRLSSSLFKRYEVVNSRFQSVGQNDIIISLRRRIVALDPFRGKELIKPMTVNISEGSSFKVPLYGSRTIGAPVSLMTNRVGQAMKSAEAYMLQLSHAKNVLSRSPHVYVYTPPLSEDANSFSGRVMAGLDELEVLGKTSGVTVSWSDNMDELATVVLKNEEREPEERLSLQMSA